MCREREENQISVCSSCQKHFQLKGIDHPEKKIVIIYSSSLTHVILNLYDFLYTVEHKYFEACLYLSMTDDSKV